jgi:hypothetical protein
VEVRKLKKKRGQMRIIEALIACSLILLGQLILTQSFSSESYKQEEEIELIGKNLLNKLEDAEMMVELENNKDICTSTIKELVESILPPNLLYNISIKSLENDKFLAEEITNIDDAIDESRYDKTTFKGIYTYSYPILQEKDVDLDIILLLDRSQSMKDTITGDDRDKLNYTKEAANNYIDNFDNTTDRFGLIAYGTTSNIERDLTFDFNMIKDKIRTFPASGQTNITIALISGKEQFQANGRGTAEKFLILLTDGKDTSRDRAMSEAQTIKSMGILIFTIGLGDKEDLDEELLIEIQSHGYFHSASGRDLENIFSLIGREMLYMTKYDVVMISITLMEP